MKKNNAGAVVVFPDEFDDRAAFEMPAKGWLCAHVEMNDGRQFSVHFTDPVRLQQDLDESVRAGKPYFAEPGLIVLPEVTVETVRTAVQRLYSQGFFDQLRPCHEIERART